MRDFFFDILNDLDKLCGLQQYIRLCAMPDGKNEINKLLDILCQSADNFKNIPEDHKKRFIRDGVMTDPEFTGMNAKVVYKWLIAKNHLYVQLEEQAEVTHEPLTGEARLKMLKEWEQAVLNIGVPQPAEHNGTRLKAVVSELPEYEGYKSPSYEDVMKSELHTQYIRENYDAISGKPKSTWIPENEWLDNLNKNL